MKKTLALCGVVFLLSACQPEVGSDKWCEALEVRDKGEWTLNEAKDFAKHCVFNQKFIRVYTEPRIVTILRVSLDWVLLPEKQIGCM